MSTIVGFDLYNTIRQVIADGVGPNPVDVSSKVLELIPVGQEREVLSVILPEVCRRVLVKPRQHRALTIRAMRSSDGSIGEKWAAVRKQMLEDPYHVAGEWILFGDLTTDNLVWLIAERETASNEFAREAVRLTNLLSLMKRQKAPTVRKLPLELLEKVMS